MPVKHDPNIRVMTFDGSSASGGTGFIAIGLIQEVQRRLESRRETRSILDEVDIFAGTSAGAVNAMLFAKYDNPREALSHAIDFWVEFININHRSLSPYREIAAIFGQAALVSTDLLRDYLISHFGRTSTLRTLKKKVVIPTFQLDNGDPEQRSWKPKVYVNFDDDEPDLDELIVDVILRSGSPPIMTPIYQGLNETGPGFVDGGIYANNPAMVAITQVCAELETPLHRDKDILLLSIGNGDSPAYVAPALSNGFGDWGYAKWLLSFSQPGAALFMILESGLMAIDYECRMILRDRYQRIDPYLPGRITLRDGSEIPETIEQVLELPNVQKQTADAAEWIMKSNWFPGTPETAQPTTAKST